jgi:hypothetical protein
MSEAAPEAPSGKAAVDEALRQSELERSGTAMGATGDVVKVVRDKTFVLREGVWIDTTFDVERMAPKRVGFLTDDYFALVAARPDWGAYLSVGERVLVVLDGQAYQVVQEDEGERIEIPAPLPTPTSDPARPKPTTSPTREVQDPMQIVRPEQKGLCGGAFATVLLALAAAALFGKRL